MTDVQTPLPGQASASPPAPGAGPLAGSHDASEVQVGAGNWKGVGMWAWLLHRVSGLVLVFYLFAHVWVISHAQQGAGSFDRMFRTLERPLFVILDIALTAAVLYHGLNGVRVLLFDFGIGIRNHKSLYYALMALAAALLVVFAFVSFAFLARGGGA